MKNRTHNLSLKISFNFKLPSLSSSDQTNKKTQPLLWLPISLHLIFNLSANPDVTSFKWHSEMNHCFFQYWWKSLLSFPWTACLPTTEAASTHATLFVYFQYLSHYWQLRSSITCSHLHEDVRKVVSEKNKTVANRS